MAAGDFIVFNQFILDVFSGKHNLVVATVDTLKMGIIDKSQTWSTASGTSTSPVSDIDDPCWGAGGTNNMLTAEIDSGVNYTDEIVMTGTFFSQPEAGIFMLDFAPMVEIEANAGDDTSAYYGVVYNDTATDKNCIGAYDFGQEINFTLHNLTMNFNANGVMRINLEQF